ncbi:MAG: F0F1 ATP synthase subunit C [Micavibrio sp.]|jgi:F0F1-type ATP synthase membrane subunit c/vacuolar-type H+-ATPase subunit K|nr:MAG: F0F1 ATP synthase subunit C [Micavibrio sp.]
MEIEAAKVIGAGIAVIPLLGVGIGLGMLFASIINAIGRNPSVENTVKGTGFLYFALIEAIALFALLIALLILFMF